MALDDLALLLPCKLSKNTSEFSSHMPIQYRLRGISAPISYGKALSALNPAA